MARLRVLALIVLSDALTAPTRAPARRPDKWGAKLALLLEYRAREGDCNVPKRHEERGVKLGTWVVDQRCAARRGALSDERRRRLVEHGFEFEPGESAWERQLERFVALRDAAAAAAAGGGGGDTATRERRRLRRMGRARAARAARHAERARQRRLAGRRARARGALGRELRAALRLHRARGHSDVPRARRAVRRAARQWLAARARARGR